MSIECLVYALNNEAPKSDNKVPVMKELMV